MSNLKYLTVDELKDEAESCEKYITTLQNKLGGQKERLSWIQHYLDEKIPWELTKEEIEQKLGHRIIIKEE